MPTEKGRKQVPAPSCSFSLSGGHIGRAFPEIFNPRSSWNQLFGTDLSLVPGQGFGDPVGPGSPLKVLDHGEIWESQVRPGKLGHGAARRRNGTAIISQLAWTCFDVLTTGTAVLAENGPVTWVQERKMKTQVRPLLWASNCSESPHACHLV